MRAGWGRPLALLALAGLLGGGFVAVQRRLSSQNDQQQRQVASDAWADLDRCLMGEARLRRERHSQYLRRVELGIPTAVRELLPAQRIDEWPYRCSRHANAITHALFGLRSDDNNVRLFASLVSQAATNLERGSLHTGRTDPHAFLDELYAMRDRVNLPAPTRAARGPLPPPPTRPLVPGDLDSVDAMEAQVALDDAVLTGSALVVLLREASSWRVCRLSRSAADAGDERLGHLRCERATGVGGLGPGRLFVGANEDVYALLGRAGGRASRLARLLLDGSVGSNPFGRVHEVVESAAYGGPDLLLLSDRSAEDPSALRPEGEALDPARRALWVRSGPGQPFTAPQGVGLPPSVPARFVGHQLVWLAPSMPAPSGADAGPEASTAASADAGSEAGAPAGERLTAWDSTWPAGATPVATALPVSPLPRRLRSCATARGTGAAVASLENGRSGELFLFDGSHWTGPTHAEAPESALLQCFAELQPAQRATAPMARFTWLETGARTVLHQLTCRESGCTPAEVLLDEFPTPPVVAPLYDRVVLAHSPRGKGLHLRVAPLARLNSAEDNIVLDDADHGGLDLAPLAQPVALASAEGEERAFLLLTAQGTTSATYLLQVEPSGRVTALPTPR